jgi:hypothetical protein
MANATNGPVDPDAGTNRRGRAERSRPAAEPSASAGTTAAAPPRRRTLPATSTTGRTPVTAPAEPARKTVRAAATGEETTRRAASRKPTAESAGQPVKSTSSRTAATGRATARKTATVKAPPPEQPADHPVEQQPEETAARPARRRSTVAAETRARRTAGAGPVSAGPERPSPTAGDRDQTSPPPEMTRGILELAAERLAASARPAEPEPRPVADGDPMAAPDSRIHPRATGVRRSSRSVTGSGLRAVSGPSPRAVSGGTRPGSGARTQDVPDHWDGASPENGWLGLPGRGSGPVDLDSSAGHPTGYAAGPSPEAPAADWTDPQPAGFVAGNGPEDQYPRIMNRPPIGLPASVRLPAELPDNLWPPKHMLERNLTENIYVPAAVPPWTGERPAVPDADLDQAGYAEQAGYADHADQAVEDRVHVPAAPVPDRYRPAVEGFTEDEHESGFLPSVMSREDTERDGAEREDTEREDTGYVPAHSRSTPPARHAAGETTGARRVRRRRAMLLTYLLAVVLVLVVGHELRGDEQPLAPGREAAQRADEPAVVGPAAAPEPAAPPTAAAGPAETAGTSGADGDGKGTAEAGEFGYARSRGPMLGTGGRLYRFRVAVEKIVDGTAPGEFAEKIDETLGDERSWTNDGRLRLRRVPKAGDDVDFTIYLASARTSEQMCATGGLDTEGFTSCRLPEQVIINADRWAGAVPDYEGLIDEYRQYTINHEVGHELGHGHEACPGKGEKAPVMMQQTFGLKGCTPNAWPYLDGERYSGKPIA